MTNREILADWADNGVLYDRATCDNARHVAQAVLAELDSWEATCDELIALMASDAPEVEIRTVTSKTVEILAGPLDDPPEKEPS